MKLQLTCAKLKETAGIPICYDRTKGLKVEGEFYIEELNEYLEYLETEGESKVEKLFEKENDWKYLELELELNEFGTGNGRDSHIMYELKNCKILD